MSAILFESMTRHMGWELSEVTSETIRGVSWRANSDGSHSNTVDPKEYQTCIQNLSIVHKYTCI